MPLHIRSLLLIAFPMAILSALAGCGLPSARVYEQTTAFTIPHQPATGLNVQTRNGSVEVRRPAQGAAEATEVTVEARLAMTTRDRLEGTTISANRTSSGTLEIRALPPDGRWYPREGCSFEIQIPDTAGVTVRTGNGRIELSGASGPARLTTSNGRIVVENHDGDVSAETSNGAVRIINATGVIKARTSNGAITARPAPSSAAASAPLDLRTSNGAITVQLPPGFAGRFDMSTSNGSIQVAERLSARLHRSGRSAATVSLGEGEEQIVSRIRTSNGGIRIDAAAAGPGS